MRLYVCCTHGGQKTYPFASDGGEVQKHVHIAGGEGKLGRTGAMKLYLHVWQQYGNGHEMQTKKKKKSSTFGLQCTVRV